jgi:hypothetical protein
VYLYMDWRSTRCLCVADTWCSCLGWFATRWQLSTWKMVSWLARGDLSEAYLSLSLSELSDTTVPLSDDEIMKHHHMCRSSHTENESWHVITHGQKIPRPLVTHQHSSRTGNSFSHDCCEFRAGILNLAMKTLLPQLVWLGIFLRSH